MSRLQEAVWFLVVGGCLAWMLKDELDRLNSRADNAAGSWYVDELQQRIAKLEDEAGVDDDPEPGEMPPEPGEHR